MRFQNKRRFIDAFQITTDYIEGILYKGEKCPSFLKISTASSALSLLAIDFQYGSNSARLNIGDWCCQDDQGNWFWNRNETFRENWETV